MMNSNKILIQIYLPLFEEEYDVFVPINKRIGTIKQLFEKSIVEQNSNYKIREDTNFYSRDTGKVLDVQLLVKDSELKNGSRVILF
ncbi:MAG: hypothetical protein IK997_02340 [Bacilli bacterium]|nr:hypothetical protein [Bacilli bacterium]